MRTNFLLQVPLAVSVANIGLCHEFTALNSTGPNALTGLTQQTVVVAVL